MPGDLVDRILTTTRAARPSMGSPTNVTRLLDSRGIKYEAFELPAEKLGAIQTAQLLQVAPEQVYKTIVVKREKPNRPLLVLVPGTATVDLKLLAKSLGEKKVFLPTESEAETLTGLRAGGISPLALLNKGFQVILDSSAEAYAEIHVSGGRRGLNIKLPVSALVETTHARILPVSRPFDESSGDAS